MYGCSLRLKSQCGGGNARLTSNSNGRRLWQAVGAGSLELWSRSGYIDIWDKQHHHIGNAVVAM